MSVLFGATPITPTDSPDISKMSKAQLFDLAERCGIDVPRGATKAKLIEMLGA